MPPRSWWPTTRRRFACSSPALICEDSGAYAQALTSFLEHDPAIEVGAFESAEALLPALERLGPDLVTMDLEMPGMGGVRAIEEIMRIRPTPILVLSAHGGKGSELAAQALTAGALEAMPKEGLQLGRPRDLWATAARRRIKRLATVGMGRRRVPRASDPSISPGALAGLDRPRGRDRHRGFDRGAARIGLDPRRAATGVRDPDPDRAAHAQDEESSAVYGMPRAAAKATTTVTLGVSEIAPALERLRPAGIRA